MVRSKAGFFENKILTIGAALIFFSSALLIHTNLKRPDIKVNKQDSSYTLNSTFLKLISLGNKRVFSNVLWIQTLMESDQERYKGKDFADWMYLRFLTISILDPKFYENYLYGGMYLSVVKDDLSGAAEIFERGMKQYPTDYYLLYYAGFNYYFEMGDYKKGYEVLKKLENHQKTPHVLKQVINKLQFEVTGDYEIAINLLKENLKTTNDEVFKRKIETDLYAVTAQRDLECLNQNQQGCSMYDLNGKPYVKRDGRWISQTEFVPYKIFRRSN